jgi:RNA polymerase II subunit A C-terminal domain phosphatase SSU72
MPGHDIRFAVVCSSNVNRSMAAHKALREAGFLVSSFGTGSQVKLPGSRPDRPIVFPFETSYADMRAHILSMGEDAYKRTGILKLLERDQLVKERPQKWQVTNPAQFDIVLTFEDRIFDQVCEDLHRRAAEMAGMHNLHVCNMNVKDSPDHAEAAAHITLDFARMLSSHDDWEDHVDAVIAAFEEKHGRPILHTVFFV